MCPKALLVLTIFAAATTIFAPRAARGSLLQEDDSGADDHVVAAEAQYEQHVTAAREALLAALSTRIKSETKAGNLDGVERATHAKEEFVNSDVIPTDAVYSTPVARYTATLSTEKKRLGAAYDSAIARYVKAGMLQAARSMREKKEKSLAPAIDPKQWGIGVWNKDRHLWERQDFPAASMVATGDSLQFLNADKNWPFVQLRYNDLVDGDFELVAEYRGSRGLALREADGKDMAIGIEWQEKVDPLKWQTVQMSRRGGRLWLVVNGVEIKPHVHQGMSPGAPGHLVLDVKAGEKVEVRQFSFRKIAARKSAEDSNPALPAVVQPQPPKSRSTSAPRAGSVEPDPDLFENGVDSRN